ncbi:MAG: hydrogenase formation protein HypD [Candidatus Sabulitectum sp.]|nr:hydrogenase formation protein HypD [Candidatus Sabulitectum sp.]
MKYIDEYRDGKLALKYAESISDAVSRQWNIMEVCGGQTNCIVKYGLDEILPSEITLIHGPGCPVCVTPVEIIDQAITIALLPDVILCSFGDMLRVPGSSGDLLSAKAEGGDVRMVYSPLDAVSIAEKNPHREVVFFAVGFETTAPVTAAAVRRAEVAGLRNFSILVAHVRVPPAITGILSSGSNIHGFLAAGHVCAVAGYMEYEPVSQEFKVPIVVTGFEPVDILQGILMVVRQLESGAFRVENQYSRVVNRQRGGAWELLDSVYEVVDRKWRGLGVIPRGGFDLRSEYKKYDASVRFKVSSLAVEEETGCRSGDVLRGLIRPKECEKFAVECTPEHPLGAPMVSSEGACAAYFRYRRR